MKNSKNAAKIWYTKKQHTAKISTQKKDLGSNLNLSQKGGKIRQHTSQKSRQKYRFERYKKQKQATQLVLNSYKT